MDLERTVGRDLDLGHLREVTAKRGRVRAVTAEAGPNTGRRSASRSPNCQSSSDERKGHQGFRRHAQRLPGENADRH
jgi:hypothetical protein